MFLSFALCTLVLLRLDSRGKSPQGCNRSIGHVFGKKKSKRLKIAKKQTPLKLNSLCGSFARPSEHKPIQKTKHNYQKSRKATDKEHNHYEKVNHLGAPNIGKVGRIGNTF
jgi:hypothetical protein